MLTRSGLVAVLLTVGACVNIGRTTSSLARTLAPEPSLAALPSGLGLAGRYPSDHGLRQDPAVVFADDVETVAAETLSTGFALGSECRWNNRWDHSWGSCRITRDTSRVHAGRRALELSLDGAGSVGVRKYFSAGFDRLFLRYYIKYDGAFASAHHAGGALQARAPGVPYVNPGVKPDGTNQFGVLLDHWSFEPAIPAPGHLVAYVYHIDQQHRWGEQFYPSGRTLPGANSKRGIFGPSFVPRENFVPALGRWYSYELMVQANTPGTNDGRVAFWVNGRLAADFPNLRFRSVASLGINGAHLGLYESRRPGHRRIWIDDIVVATAYIGPMTPTD